MKTRGAHGEISKPWNLIALCRFDHVLWGQVGAIQMVKNYPKLKGILERKGWEFCPVAKKWIIPYDIMYEKGENKEE